MTEFRKYQQLTREVVGVSERVCRLRPLEDTLTPEEKNGRAAPSKGGRARSSHPAGTRLRPEQTNQQGRNLEAGGNGGSNSPACSRPAAYIPKLGFPQVDPMSVLGMCQ